MQHTSHQHYELLAPNKPSHVVVFLHGLGASGHDLLPLADWLQAKLPHHAIAWQFPHAANQPVTLNGGMIMPAWFDLYEIEFRAKEDLVGMNHAKAQIWDYLSAWYQQGIPWQNIYLCGFSQGGALALYSALNGPEQLGGVACFSGYLPQRAQLKKQQTAPQLPIWLVHGLHDEVVPIDFFELSKQSLESLCCPHLTTCMVPMGHEISLDALAGFVAWLQPLINTQTNENTKGD